MATSVAEAEGVSMKIWSLTVSAAMAREEPVVTGPAMICMPQSFREL